MDASIEALCQGNDIFKTRLSFCMDGGRDYQDKDISISWDGILTHVGPDLLNECSEEMFIDKLNLCAFHTLNDAEFEKADHTTHVMPIVSVDSVKTQLRALGFMSTGTKRRSVTDQKVYWKLTDAGERHLTSIKAIKRRPAPPSLAEGSAKK